MDHSQCTSAKSIVKSGEDHIFEGDICVVKWGGESRNKKCLKVPNPISKLVFKAYFPDSLHDVSDKLVISQSEDKKSWKYCYKTDKIVNTDLNQFTFTVGTGDKKTNDLLAVKAKLEKRIAILKDFKIKYAGKTEYQENLNFINKLISYLDGIIVKIDIVLQNNPEILAQVRIPLQVDNKLSAPFFYSSNFSGYKLTLKLPVGVLFEGETAHVEASVTNISDTEATIRELAHHEKGKSWFQNFTTETFRNFIVIAAVYYWRAPPDEGYLILNGLKTEAYTQAGFLATEAAMGGVEGLQNRVFY